jgi:predicted Ser/Thr protein kinase
MVLATVKQCETHRQVMLPQFNERYKKLKVDHPDAKKKMDQVQASIVQIGQRVQNSPKVNGYGTKWKQLAHKQH